MKYKNQVLKRPELVENMPKISFNPVEEVQTLNLVRRTFNPPNLSLSRTKQ